MDLQQLDGLVGDGCSSHGGVLALSKPFRLCIDIDAPRTLTFPLNDGDRQCLLSKCEPASFGKGEIEVLDPNYRKALRLNADDFFVNLDLAETGLLDEVAQVLCTQQKQIQLHARLDKLNVMEKGGFFKGHKDTPKGSDFLGTLVVILPSEFEGGELLVKGAQPATFAWPDKTALQYACFWSDVEHEILEIKSGLRVSLAYDLYAKQKADVVPSVFPPLATGFAALLEDPSFMKNGGHMGYHLQHLYPVTREDPSQLPNVLKGKDAAFMSTAKLFGLKTELYALWNRNAEYTEDREEPEDDSDGSQSEAGPNPRSEFVFSHVWAADGDRCTCLGEDSSCWEALNTNCRPVAEPEGLEWINSRSSDTLENALTVAHYGNQPSTDTFYNSGCLVIEIPEAEKRNPPQTIAGCSIKRKRDLEV